MVAAFINTLLDQEFWTSDGFLHMLTTIPFNASLAVTTFAFFLFVLNASASRDANSTAECKVPREVPREKMLEVVAHARQGVSEEREEMEERENAMGRRAVGEYNVLFEEASAALTTLEAVLSEQRGYWCGE